MDQILVVSLPMMQSFGSAATFFSWQNLHFLYSWQLQNHSYLFKSKTKWYLIRSQE